MRIKELKRTVNVCWSPAEYYPITLAAGSAAQQVDASFSSSSHLELYSLNLEDPGLDLELKSSLQTQHKFQKLVWSGAGVIVGGCDGGLLEFYSADKLLNNATDCLLGTSTKHNGHVSALDVNPYQKNLLASGASESEIFIWDLNNTSQPMAPGTRNQPYDHVQGLAWNQQVQHILGSTFATRCVVWDLRKNEPIMKLSDSQSRTRWRALAWHPSVATQLCIASEDDQVPVIQLWDLRLAASPLATLEGHHKGVMSVSWCRQDPDMMLSGGKDGRVLCWNPNNTKPGGEVLSEISEQQQWVFDVSWCPRDPNLLSAASFDQHVAVHCLLGGARPDVSPATNSIVESFGGAASFSQLPVVSRAPPTTTASPHHQPPTPPAWLKRPSAAKFAFGGKLVTFEKYPQEAGAQKLVSISQVVSEPEIVEQAAELDAVLSSSIHQEPGSTEKLAEYCRQKGDAAMDQNERYLWFFLRANFLPTFRTEVLNLLGFKQDEIPSKFKSATNAGDAQPDPAALSRGESTETEAELSTDTSTDLSDAHTLIERKLANIEITSSANNVVIPNGDDITSLICRALVCGNLEEAVELCLEAGRVADAMIIASLGSQELVSKVQTYHLNSTSGSPVSLVAGAVLHSRWDELVRSAAASSWKDTLATLLTHCDSDALDHYCEMLGDKLSMESDPSLSAAATLCYVCGVTTARVGRGGRVGGRQRAALALLLRRAAALRGRPVQSDGGDPAVCEYASRVAAQGCLHSALLALADLPTHPLRDRLEGALAIKQQHQPQQQYQPRARTTSSHSQKHRGPHNDGNLYNQSAASFEQSPWQQASVPGVPYQQRAYQQPQPQPPPQPIQPQLPQPPQPPRPASVGPHGGLPSRSKYKVDPSVQPAPQYNQYAFNNQTQPYGGFNSPLPDQYSNASVPSVPSAPSVPNTFTPINPAMNRNPGPLNPMNPLNPAPLNPMTSLNQAPLNTMNPLNPAMNPAVNGGYYGGQQMDPPPHPKPAPAGWNDPPMVTSKPKPKQEAPNSQAPITHPLFGVEPPQHVPLAPTPAQYPGQQYPGQQYQAQQYSGQQYPGQQYQEQQYQQYPPAMQPAYPQHTESVPPPPEPAPAPAPAPAPVQKPPLPEEHLVLQQVFDSLRSDCVNKAVNAQMKRKLEDVQRRLETLYDLLREYRLSEATLSALHSCSQQIQAGDLPAASHTVASLASGTDFAAAAAFLPGLKALLQVSAQLQR